MVMAGSWQFSFLSFQNFYMRFSLIFLLQIAMLADSRLPISSPLPSVRHSPIVPAILGTWQAGHLWAVDRKTKQLHVDRSPINPELSDQALMPYGQRIEFTNGYDQLSNVAYWQAFWLLPYPANSCQYPFLQYHCTDINGVQVPTQTIFQLEFTMRLMPSEIVDFAPVDASKTGKVYFLRCGGNDEWVPVLYISRDRMCMWSIVGVDDNEHYYGLQEYHRVAEYKRR